MTSSSEKLHCALRNIGQDPIRGGRLYGLRLQDGEMFPDPEIFNCCKGKGLYLGPQDFVVQCDLRLRTTRTLKLYWDILTILQRHEVPFATSEFDKSWLRLAVSKLSSQLAGSAGEFGKQDSAPQGFLCRLSASQSFRMADLGLVAQWQLGINTQYLDFMDHKSWSDGQPFQGDAKLLVVDHVGKLWLPDQRLQFDLLVSYLYQSSLPFWINFSSLDKSKPLSVRATVSQRVEALKQASLEKLLSAQALARLRLMVGSPMGALAFLA